MSQPNQKIIFSNSTQRKRVSEARIKVYMRFD